MPKQAPEVALKIEKEMRLEECYINIATIFEDVGPSRYPIYRWMNVVDDATQLGEEIRRARFSEARNQLARTFGRLLEFIGYYLRIHKPPIPLPKVNKKTDLRLWDLLAMSFNHRSSMEPRRYPRKESLTKWILKKFPRACGKCGKAPCHCVVKPWGVEGRREDPEIYYLEFLPQVKNARKKLRSWDDFTLEELFRLFDNIYKNSYYHQDPWKIAMHLNEEIGEATVQLARLELLVILENNDDDNSNKNKVLGSIDEIYKYYNRHITKKTAAISKEYKERVSNEWETTHNRLIKRLNSAQRDPARWLERNWNVKGIERKFRKELACRLMFAELISDRLKEELADIISWIISLSYRLSSLIDNNEFYIIEELGRIYSIQPGGVEIMGCPNCENPECNDKCLIGHDLGDEILQSVIKM